MIPTAALLGVSGIGYALDKLFRENEFNDNNEDNPLPKNNDIDGCKYQYPWNFNNNNNNIENFKDFVPKKNLMTPTSIKYPSKIEAINEAGNPSPPYFIDANKRPVEDFKVNNMVPFFRGSGTNQNMAGTGVPQGNINSNDFKFGNDNETANKRTLSTFTGCDDVYLHKREVPNMFSPLEQRINNTIPGESSSSTRPNLDRYTTSITTKNDEAPFERIQVGPGLNINTELPNDGQGYNSGLTSNVKLNNVNSYKINQLPGRIAGAKYQYSNLPTALPGSGPGFDPNDPDAVYGVPQKKPSLELEITPERRQFMPTATYIQKPMYYSNIVFPSGTDKRSQSNISFGSSVQIS